MPSIGFLMKRICGKCEIICLARLPIKTNAKYVDLASSSSWSLTDRNFYPSLPVVWVVTKAACGIISSRYQSI